MATQESHHMLRTPNRMAAIFIDRACTEHWIVRDPEGNFWIVPPMDNAWENRIEIEPSDEMDLEPVPGHYRYMLGLPF